MKRKIYLGVILILLCIMGFNVSAASSSDSVSKSLTEYSCSKFQDSNMHIASDTYFGRCMQATCNGSNWELRYYSTNSVSCSNGNLNPYIKITKDGCSSYKNNSCNGSSVKYCTTLSYFDCNRTSNGSKYTTTTKRRPTSTKVTTTTEPPTTTQPTTTTPILNANTYLASLSISTGNIQFNKDVREYSIDIESTISSINVSAVPEVETSKVEVLGNSNLVSGSNKITINVTAEDGSVGTYIINVNKKESLGTNAKLASLTIDGYELNFDSEIYNYNLKIKKEDSLTIEAETEDKNAIYMIEGNNNLKDNSVIKVIVTAGDGLTMQEYTITVNKSSNGFGVFLTILFIIILIVVIGAGVFYFYIKKKNAGEKEYEYE